MAIDKQIHIRANINQYYLSSAPKLTMFLFTFDPNIKLPFPTQFRKEKHVIGLMHSLVLTKTQTRETLMMKREFDHSIDGVVGT